MKTATQTTNAGITQSNDDELLAELDELIKDLKVEDETLPADARGGQLFFPTFPTGPVLPGLPGLPVPPTLLPPVIFRPPVLPPIPGTIDPLQPGGLLGCDPPVPSTVMCPW